MIARTVPKTSDSAPDDDRELHRPAEALQDELALVEDEVHGRALSRLGSYGVSCVQ